MKINPFVVSKYYQYISEKRKQRKISKIIIIIKKINIIVAINKKSMRIEIFIGELLFEHKLMDAFLDASHRPPFKPFNFLFQNFCFMILNTSNAQWKMRP